MTKDQTILVCGIGEEAPATARRLFGDGYAVVLYRATAPEFLRRKMCFADAWYEGNAYLDGIEVRRADVSSEFLLGLRTREFIPLLRAPLGGVIDRWPWDVIIVAREEEEPAPSLRHLADVTIGLGSHFSAGVDCDLVIEIDGLDPGAILRQGDAPWRRRARALRRQPDELLVIAPAQGRFLCERTIGAFVERGESLGSIDGVEIRAPRAGRIRGLARQKRAVVAGAPLVEIASSPMARCVGISDRSQLISRGISFAVEMECDGLTPLPVGNWW
jgi:xanthine dehydrogenase accessory factor